MKFTAIILLSLVAATLAVKPPTLPQSFSVEESDTMEIHQGQYSVDGNKVCCTVGDDCKIQLAQQAGNNYIDAENQRTRFDLFGSDQSIFNDFKTGREYAVVNNTCQDWCPMQDDDFGTFGIDPNATLISSSASCGQNETCSDWQWKDVILGVIVMDINDFFVTQKDGKWIPVAQTTKLTPFGQPIGQQSSVWTNFVPGVPAASHFNIAGLSSCKKSNQCNQNSNSAFSQLRLFNRIKNKMFKTWAYYQQQ